MPCGPVGSSYAASADAAASRAVSDGVLQRYATEKAKATGVAPSRDAVPQKAADAVPVYELSPAFVRSGAGPVGEARYAVTTYALGSEKASVASAPQADGVWRAVNVASGDTEARMAAAAQGSPLLHEPQVDAWYAVRGGRVVALDTDARSALGKGSATVAEYAALVHDRYSDKLPGSAYDTSGYAGGYAVSAPKAAGTTHGVVWGAGGVAALAAGAVALSPRTRTALRSRGRAVR
ncbi:hypothetical protein [Luteipulveratus halotolerans]|uniref:hypothetical protein n=1 Tax=Luteipulveratus halotolerans TaxID=1631356 RepID=UPI0012FAE08E|nr:hypothetical protein [Luteipulveratus halotolerans]